MANPIAASLAEVDSTLEGTLPVVVGSHPVADIHRASGKQPAEGNLWEVRTVGSGQGILVGLAVLGGMWLLPVVAAC